MKIFLNGYYGAGNLGDDLMERLILDHLLNRRKDVTECIVNYVSPPKSLHSGIRVHRKHSGRLGQLFQYVSDVRECDAYIWGGGTFLYSGPDNGWFNLFLIFLHIFIARLLGLKVLLIGIGYGPLNGIASRLLANSIVRMSNLITARDSKSFEEMKGLNPRTFITDDLVFALPVQIEEKKDDSPFSVAISLVYYHTYDFGLLLDVLGRLTSAYPAVSIHFVPFLENRNISDLAVHEALAGMTRERFPHMSTHIHAGVNPDSKVQIIANSDLVMASRLHALVLATLHRKRIYPIIYHEKVEKFMRRIDFSGEYINSANSVQSLGVPSSYTAVNIEGAWHNFVCLDKVLAEPGAATTG